MRHRRHVAYVGGSGGGSGSGGGFGTAAAAWREGVSAAAEAIARASASASASKTSGSAATAGPGYLEEVVLLDIRGTHCGGCVGNVRKAAAAGGSEPACVSASVNLANESALVRVGVEIGDETSGGDASGAGDGSFEALVQRVVRVAGETLSTAVDSGGFPGLRPRHRRRERRGRAAEANARERTLDKHRPSTRRVVVAWALAATCLIGHRHPRRFPRRTAPWRLVLLYRHEAARVARSLCWALRAGDSGGRDGVARAASDRPQRTALVSLGALASFGMSSAAVAMPRLGSTAHSRAAVML